MTELRSFDRTESFEGELVQPDRYRHLLEALRAEGPVIPRGAGLSYCAASGGTGCRSISSHHFKRKL